MDIQEFNSIAVRTEDTENVYFDLRPFGDRQSEAMDTYMHGSLMKHPDGSKQFWLPKDSPHHGCFRDYLSDGAYLSGRPAGKRCFDWSRVRETVGTS